MADLFGELKEDHRRIHRILDALRGDPAAEAADPSERTRMADELVSEESRHEAAEELVLWPTVRRALPTGEELAVNALSQERVGKKLLNEMQKTSAGTEEFETLFHRTASALRTHIMYEEIQVFRRLATALDETEAQRLGQLVADARASAPTRPHTHTPADPRVLGTVGPWVATVDRLRDLVTGRG